ncbi:chaperone NapD [Pantoea sp. LMR881]|uniref:chaperone NapD n=1 Tax=Pantoea sp. LMR881 TaxID=3014336 RepID=UPI0022AFD3E7|nr:chaperone NapD [Pantoea sp. LMR881]MCZ4060507.1 chaperone NapD [Pantoea sp. LMR881]
MDDRTCWHVCGLVIQARAADFPAVQSALLVLDDADIAAASHEKGTLAVTLGAPDAASLLRNIESTRDIPGVLAVSLVYHQQDEGQEQCKEVS